MEVTVHEAKTHLSRLLACVEAGEEVVIKRGRKPVARLERIGPPPPRELGRYNGLLVMPPEYFEPLPDELLDAFEGGRGP